MFGSTHDHRQHRPASPSAREAGPARDHVTGSLLDAAETDAATRHAIARSRRLRKASPLLGGLPDPQPEPDIDAEAPGREPEPGHRMAAADEVPEFPDAVMPAHDAGRAAPAGRSRAGILAAATLAGAAIGAMIALSWPSGYVATSEVMIDPRGMAGNAAALDHDAAMTLVDSQLRVLRSGTMLGAAADRLNLAADPEFGAAGGLIGSILGDDAAAGRLRTIEKLADAVTVERAGGTSVVAISARTADPRKSALIANTISELFVAEAATASGADSGRRAALRQAVEEAERAIEAFKRENELVDAQGRLISDDEIVRLGELVSAARARTVELNARAASTREANVDSIVTGSLPEQFASPTLAELRARYADSKQQLDRLSVKLGPRHPERLAAQAELEGARQEITAELRRVAAALQTELKRAVEQEQQLASQLAQLKVRQGGIGDEMVRLREMERDAQAKRAAYEDSLHAAQLPTAPGSTGSASIISRAEPPTAAAGPSFAGLTLAGGLAGLLAGLGLTRRRRGDGDDAFALPNDTPIASQDRPDAAGDAHDAESGKEADAMYPHYPYAHPQAADPRQQQQPAAAPQMQTPPYPMAWQPTAPAMGWPPAPPMQWMPPAPAPYPPAYDPWAYQRAAAMTAYAPPPAPPVQTVVYVPVPVAAPAAQQVEAAAYREPARAEPQRQAPRQRHAADHFDQDDFIDERTNEAIEEIRQSLREFREAIEDLADSRYDERRYGT